jgi:arylsulfatase A-like enzyme
LDDAPARGFLLWVHLSEPHLPYEHAPDPERFHGELFDALRAGEPWTLSRAALLDAYRWEVTYLDRQIMRLLRSLEGRGHFGEGILVFAADHGEEMLEHGSGGHGHSHHGEVLDVPLAIVAPGAPARVRDELASLEDVASTVRATLGHEPHGVDLRGPIAADRVASADGNLYFGRERSLRVGSLRIIERDHRDARDVRVYDLSTDPGELVARPPTDTEAEVLHSAFAAVRPPGSEAERRRPYRMAEASSKMGR